MIPVEIDENVLTQISTITGGKYFRADNNKKLKEIYNEIDKLEKTKIEITPYNHTYELFYSWLSGGLILIFLELGLSKTILRKIP